MLTKDMVVSFSSWIKYFVILGVSAAIIGCALPSGDTIRSTSNADRVLRLHFIESGSESSAVASTSLHAASATDTQFADVVEFTVSGINTGNNDAWSGETLSRDEFIESSSIDVPLSELSEGTWQFSIVGIDDGGDTIFEGTAQVQLREQDFGPAGNDDPVIAIPVQLLPLDGDGEFSVTVSIADQQGTLNPTHITFSVIPYNVDRAQGTWEQDYSELINRSITFEEISQLDDTTVPAGYYELRFTITGEDGDGDGAEIPGGRGVTGFRIRKDQHTTIALTVREEKASNEVDGINDDAFLMVSHTVEDPFDLEISASYTKFPQQPGIKMNFNPGTSSAFDIFDARAFRWLVNGRLYNVRTQDLKNTLLQPVDFGVHRVDLLVNPLGAASSSGQREAVEELLFVGSTTIEVLPTGGFVLRIEQDMQDPVPITIYEVTNSSNGDTVSAPSAPIEVAENQSRVFLASVAQDVAGDFEWTLNGRPVSTNAQTDAQITITSWKFSGGSDFNRLNPGMNQLTVLFREENGASSSASISLQALYE